MKGYCGYCYITCAHWNSIGQFGICLLITVLVVSKQGGRPTTTPIVVPLNKRPEYAFFNLNKEISWCDASPTHTHRSAVQAGIISLGRCSARSHDAHLCRWLAGFAHPPSQVRSKYGNSDKAEKRKEKGKEKGLWPDDSSLSQHIYIYNHLNMLLLIKTEAKIGMIKLPVDTKSEPPQLKLFTNHCNNQGVTQTLNNNSTH